MTALKGFVNGHTVVADDFLGNMYDGKEVIITILDTFRNKKKAKAVKTKKYTADDVKDAFGLWKNHEISENVEEYVRSVRKGRNFGI